MRDLAQNLNLIKDSFEFERLTIFSLQVDLLNRILLSLMDVESLDHCSKSPFADSDRLSVELLKSSVVE